MKNFLKFIVLFSFVIIINSELNPHRLRIVDKDQELKNYLVRGNLPISAHKHFQIRELKENLTRITGLQNFELYVVSFLNFLTAKQTKNRYIEEKFFEKNPDQGRYRTKLILGSLLDPQSFPDLIVDSLNFLSSFVDIDNIDEFIAQLHEQIHKKGKKKIIFIHCSAGMDRTGYVAGSYKLKYLNYPMKKVIEQNSHFGGHRKQMHFPFLYGLKWFCLSVKGNRQQCLMQKSK